MSARWKSTNPYLAAWWRGGDDGKPETAPRRKSGVTSKVAAATRDITEVFTTAWLAPLALRPARIRRRR